MTKDTFRRNLGDAIAIVGWTIGIIALVATYFIALTALISPLDK